MTHGRHIWFGIGIAQALLAQACASHDAEARDAATLPVDAGLTPVEVASDATAAPSLDTGLADDAATEAAATPCEEAEAGLPSDLFCTGLYVGRDPSQISSDLTEYVPGVVLWSDGAEKRRFLYLPPGSQIDTSDMDRWRFPVGTKAWKEFRLDGVVIETRLLYKRSEARWESGTYLWDATGTRAELNTARKGIVLDAGYEIPSPRDCDKCHHGGADKLLGVEAVALALPSAQGVTLTSLVAAGALSHPPATTSLELPEDETGKAAYALGYLHANCGMPCHSTRGLGDETQLVLRLRADEFWPRDQADAGAPVAVSVALTDIYRATVGQPPTTASVAQAFPNAVRIQRGEHELSLVWQLAHRRGNYQMPPLVSHRIDEVGTQRLADWIDALPR